jgi:very-short-patch-repair endonuclease
MVMERDSKGQQAHIVAIARRQHGLVTTEQAIACGISRRSIEHRIASGSWSGILRGVYVVGGAPDTFEQRLLARLLLVGADAVASHAAAARIWRLPGFGEQIEWSRPRGGSQRRPAGRCHGSLWLPDRHRTMQGRIPVTTVARTVFDLAGTMHPQRAERALDNALSRRLCTFGQLVAVHADLARRGRRGTSLMRELLDARGPGYIPPNSELEALGRAVLGAAGLTDFEVEVDLGDGNWVGRVDLLFRTSRLVVELDGRTYHQAKLDFEADRRRDNRLMSAGWRVLRVTWDDLRLRPAEVTAQVRIASSAATRPAAS